MGKYGWKHRKTIHYHSTSIHLEHEASLLLLGHWVGSEWLLACVASMEILMWFTYASRSPWGSLLYLVPCLVIVYTVDRLIARCTTSFPSIALVTTERWGLAICLFLSESLLSTWGLLVPLIFTSMASRVLVRAIVSYWESCTLLAVWV